MCALGTDNNGQIHMGQGQWGMGRNRKMDLRNKNGERNGEQLKNIAANTN